MISYLRYTLNVKECPRWWKESDLGYEMYDENVVEAIYDKVLEHEVQWMRAVWGDEHVDQLLGKGKQDVGEEAGKQKGA